MPRLLDAIAARHGYVAGAGMSKAQFTRRHVRLLLRDELEAHEASAAAASASEQVRAAIRAEMGDEA